jgi:hypothetical protein
MQPYNNTSPTSDPDGAVYLVLDDFGRFGRRGVGAVLLVEASQLARNGRDWQRSQ